MTDRDRIDAVNALLVQAAEAHHVFETTELGGAYDRDWPRWYAAYAVEQGIGVLVGHPVTIDRLEQLLTSSNTAFEQTESKPTESWAAYAARRIVADLSRPAPEVHAADR